MNVKKLFLLLGVALYASTCHAAMPKVFRFKDPLSAEEHAQLGGIYEQQGLLLNAKREYQASVRNDKTKVESWIALGNIAFERHRYTMSQRYFRHALRVAPQNPSAMNNLAMVYLTTDHLKKARTWAERAEKVDGPI